VGDWTETIAGLCGVPVAWLGGGMRHKRVDKSQLAIAVPKRIRCPAHLAYVNAQQCCVPGCGWWGVDVHHLLSSGAAKARGKKNGDNFTVPLCHYHHLGDDSPHGWGDERAWADHHGLDLEQIASYHWQQSVKAGRYRE
jgi:hypothetical protein